MIMTENRKKQFRYISLIQFTLVLMMVGGCTESVRQQYAELGEWDEPKDVPNVISSTPDADRAAFQDAEAVLTDADWKTLEEISPPAIWERIGVQRKRHLAERTEQGANGESAIVDFEPARKPSSGLNLVVNETSPIDLDNVALTELADGRLRIVYTLQNHGGVEASASGRAERRRWKLFSRGWA